MTPHVGRSLELYAKAIFDRALTLVEAYMQAGMQQRQLSGSDASSTSATSARGANLIGDNVEYDPNYIILALDVISGMAQGLHSSVESLVAASPLVQMLMICCT